MHARAPDLLPQRIRLQDHVQAVFCARKRLLVLTQHLPPRRRWLQGLGRRRLGAGHGA